MSSVPLPTGSEAFFKGKQSVRQANTGPEVILMTALHDLIASLLGPTIIDEVRRRAQANAENSLIVDNCVNAA